jgi:carboxypeptidase family protein
MVRRSSVLQIGLIGLIGLIGPIGGPATAAGAARQTVTVSGKVLDPRGRPAGAATVTVSASDNSNPFGDPDREPVVRETTTAADGSFRLEMTVPSEHWGLSLVAIKAGFGPGSQRCWRGRSTTGLALALSEASFVAGRVVDDAGRPVAGARVGVKWVILSPGDGGYQIPEAALPPAITDAQGKFRLAPLPAHCHLELGVEHPAYVAPLGASDQVRTGQEDVTISVVPAGAIAGRVVYDDGRPAAKVGVFCLTTGTGVPRETTDAGGRFRFSRLLPGAYLLLPEPAEELAEFEGSTERVVVSLGSEARCPDLTLKRLAGSAVLSGKVTDEATGQAVADVGIITQRQISSTGMLNMPIEGPITRTGTDGTYRMRLPPGTWHAYAAYLPPGYRDGPRPTGPSELPAAPGKSFIRDFTLTKETAETVFRGQVLDAGGRPAPGAKLRAMPGGVETTDIDGRFRLPLYFGPANRSGAVPTRLAVLSLDRSQGVVLDLPPGELKGPRIVRLRRFPLVPGVLTDERSAPIPHVEVRAEVVLSRRADEPDAFATALAAATTDVQGRFSLPLVPGTACRVLAEPADFVPERRVIELKPGAPPAPMKLRLRRGGGAVAGTAVDADGRPLPGVQVTACETGQLYYNGPPFASATSDAQGRYRLEHLPAGEVNVNAWLPGYYNDNRQRVKVGVSQLRLTLAPMSRPTTPPTPLAAGTRAPEIQVTEWVNGTAVPSLAALRGKTVLLQFSSAYNSAAKGSNAALKALQARLQEENRSDVVILALYDSSASTLEVEAYARAEGLSFPIGIVQPARNAGPGDGAFPAYGVRRLPTLIVIDAEGIVRAVDPDRESLMRLAR